MKRIDNLAELSERSCQRFAERPRFATKRGNDWQWTTYAQFEANVGALRRSLAEYGIVAGDRVAIVSNNSEEWATVAYAAYGLGAVLVPMYEAQRPQDWEYILRDSGARLVFGSSAVAPALESLRAQLSGLEQVVSLERAASGEQSLPQWIAQGRARPLSAGPTSGDALATVIYTSGTTGLPKGVMLSHGNLTSNVASITSIFPLGEDDVFLSFLPWAHIYAQTIEVHAACSIGAATVLNDRLEHLLTNLVEVRPTILIAVPRIFSRLHERIQHELDTKPRVVRTVFEAAVRLSTRRKQGQLTAPLGRALLTVADATLFKRVRASFGGRLKYAISGSAALNPRVADFIDALGIEVYEGYGLTETSPIVSANVPGARKLGSAGRPIPGVSVRIDTSRGAGKDGEIVVYGPNVMQGYLNRPQETAEALDGDGGLRTGDLGYVDDDGYLHITGRIKERYKLENGKYVMPSPLEEQLKLSPYIANVVLYGANRPFNVALITPNSSALQEWARREQVELGDVPANPAVVALLERELKQYSQSFREYEKPRAFLVAQDEFTTANGMLTPTLKAKRSAIFQKYAPALDALYSSKRGPAGTGVVASELRK